jgi:predicted Rdx family selenoprotein
MPELEIFIVHWRQSQGLYRILWIAQYLPTPELEIFIVHWRQSQGLYRILWIAQYLPTPELEIFIGKYSMMPELGILEDDHRNKTQTNL